MGLQNGSFRVQNLNLTSDQKTHLPDNKLLLQGKCRLNKKERTTVEISTRPFTVKSIRIRDDEATKFAKVARTRKTFEEDSSLIWQRSSFSTSRCLQFFPPPPTAFLSLEHSPARTSHKARHRGEKRRSVSYTSILQRLSTCRAYGRWRERGTGEIEQEKGRIRRWSEEMEQPEQRTEGGGGGRGKKRKKYVWFGSGRWASNSGHRARMTSNRSRALCQHSATEQLTVILIFWLSMLPQPILKFDETIRGKGGAPTP